MLVFADMAGLHNGNSFFSALLSNGLPTQVAICYVLTEIGLPMNPLSSNLPTGATLWHRFCYDDIPESINPMYHGPHNDV